MSAFTGLLQRLVERLDAAGIPFMVAGSFASTAHGLPRIIDPPSQAALDAFVSALPSTEYYVDRDAARDALVRRSMFNVIDNASGWKVDFIVRKNRPFSREELARRMKLPLAGVDVFVATPEDTIVAKLEWSAAAGGSERQRRDVAGILTTTGPALDRAYVERWVHDLGLEEEWRLAQATPP